MLGPLLLLTLREMRRRVIEECGAHGWHRGHVGPHVLEVVLIGAHVVLEAEVRGDEATHLAAFLAVDERPYDVKKLDDQRAAASHVRQRTSEREHEHQRLPSSIYS